MTHEEEFMEEFAELDLDGDGYITRDEFLTQLEGSKPKADAPDFEHRFYHKTVEMFSREFDQYDLNQDGRISQDEYFAVRREAAAVSEDYREFLEWDKDSSGYLIIEELPAAPEFATGVARSPEAELFHRRRALLLQYDTDGDGRVQLDEFLAARKRARVEARNAEKAST